MSTEHPLVSVHIQTYNSARFIRETLDSVLAQDYPNFEIVIADDASTDETQTILQNYQKKFPDKIRLILNPVNLGVTKNANVVLSACQGKYIALLGSDDLMLPNRLTEQVKLMESDHNIVVAHHNVEGFKHETGERLWLKDEHLKTGHLTPHDLLVRSNPLISCEVMMRASDLPSKGYNESFPYLSDFVLLFEILANHPQGKVSYTDQVLTKYRVRQDSLIHTPDSHIRRLCDLDALNFLNWCLLFYPEYGKSAQKYYSDLLRAHRRSHHGKYYRLFLSLSLRVCFNLKAALAYLLSFFSKKLL